MVRSPLGGGTAVPPAFMVAFIADRRRLSLRGRAGVCWWCLGFGVAVPVHRVWLGYGVVGGVKELGLGAWEGAVGMLVHDIGFCLLVSVSVCLA